MIRNTVTKTTAAAPGRSDRPPSFPESAMSHPLAQLLGNETGRSPCHERDHHGERKHVLVGAREGQRDGADGLQPGEQESAEYRTVDTAEPADDGGAESHHAEIEPDTE